MTAPTPAWSATEESVRAAVAGVRFFGSLSRCSLHVRRGFDSPRPAVVSLVLEYRVSRDHSICATCDVPLGYARPLPDLVEDLWLRLARDFFATDVRFEART